MSALAVLDANLISSAPKPVTAATGGLSQGDPNAGSHAPKIKKMSTIGLADKTGAGCITGLTVIILLIGAWWMLEEP